jgi:SAM-dependent methyltransferase
MNPQPLAAEVRHRYQETYLQYELANEGAFLRLQELSLDDVGFAELEAALLAKAVPPSVLDIGCATGALLERLQSRGWRTTGVEICVAEADHARRVRGLDVRSIPLEENRFPDAAFDVVMASHLIEHLNDPAGFVAEVHRILCHGGYFLLTTPNSAGFQARLFRGRWRSAIFDHLYLFSKGTLSALLVRSGFSVERICTWGGLATGTVPLCIKGFFDRAAKRFGFGDVMILLCRTCDFFPRAERV